MRGSCTRSPLPSWHVRTFQAAPYSSPTPAAYGSAYACVLGGAGGLCRANRASGPTKQAGMLKKPQHCCVADCLHIVHVLCWGPYGMRAAAARQPTLMVFMTVLSCAFALAGRGGSSSGSISISKSSEPPGASSSNRLPCSASHTRQCAAAGCRIVQGSPSRQAEPAQRPVMGLNNCWSHLCLPPRSLIALEGLNHLSPELLRC